jgi:hypothetical protein
MCSVTDALEYVPAAFSDAGADRWLVHVAKEKLAKFRFSDVFRYLKIPYTSRMLRSDAFQASTLTKKVLDT